MDKIIGFAIGHHLMNSMIQAAAGDNMLVLSSERFAVLFMI